MDAKQQTGDASEDAGTDFCSWGSSTAQAHAEHACAWLGACAGSEDLNDFGACYPLALMAYDCVLNPNQQVRGALHAYWDSLWQVKSCDDVRKAIFAGQSIACNNPVASCGSDLVSGAFKDVAVACADGGFSVAVNCAAAGFGCQEGECKLLGERSCTGSPLVGCDGTIFHSCQPVENNPDASPTTLNVDVGKDCQYFGAGACTLLDGGFGGCAPSNAATPCTPSAIATCSDGGAYVLGCPTGVLESLKCPNFHDGNSCSVVGGWFAPSNDLPLGCYNPNENDYGTMPVCTPSVFSDYAGPAGFVTVGCADAGLNASNCPGGDAGPYCKQPGE